MQIGIPLLRYKLVALVYYKLKLFGFALGYCFVRVEEVIDQRKVGYFCPADFLFFGVKVHVWRNE